MNGLFFISSNIYVRQSPDNNRDSCQKFNREEKNIKTLPLNSKQQQLKRSQRFLFYSFKITILKSTPAEILPCTCMQSYLQTFPQPSQKSYPKFFRTLGQLFKIPPSPIKITQRGRGGGLVSKKIPKFGGLES